MTSRKRITQVVQLVIGVRVVVHDPNPASTPRDAADTTPRRERALFLGIGQ